MTQTGQPEKNALRREKRLLRKSLSVSDRADFDSAIRRTLERLPEYQAASVIAAYATDGSEPDLLPLLQKAVQDGKTVCLPRRVADSDYEMAVADSSLHLVPGKWNIPEPGPEAPAAAQKILTQALWLVPGVAFDENCARLGRGKGVYDRMLSRIEGPAIGIFYECQKTEKIPAEEHDRLLQGIVTERRVYRSGNCRKP